MKEQAIQTKHKERKLHIAEVVLDQRTEVAEKCNATSLKSVPPC